MRPITDFSTDAHSMCIDPRVPVAYGFAAKPESGPSVFSYYGELHKRGIFGTYWPLHEVSRKGKSR